MATAPGPTSGSGRPVRRLRSITNEVAVLEPAGTGGLMGKGERGLRNCPGSEGDAKATQPDFVPGRLVLSLRCVFLKWLFELVNSALESFGLLHKHLSQRLVVERLGSRFVRKLRVHVHCLP